MSTLLQLWREVCGRSPALVNQEGKHLIVSESDCALLGSEIERASPTPAAQSAGQGAVAHIATRKMDGERFLVWPNNVASYKKYTDDFDVVDLYAAPVNGGERERAIEEAAQIADTFKCGTCGMDGKCAAAIRKLAGERAADAQQVGQCVPLDELYADAAYLSHRVQQGTLSPDDLAKHIRTKIDAALTSPAKDAQQAAMTDRQIIELCKSVGVEWEGPDMCDFMGDFGRVNMAGMRAIINAAKEQK